MEIKDIISKVINAHRGIDASELVLEVMRQAAYVSFPNEEFDNALFELVKDGEIVEVEYTMPSMDYRVKSWYLPKDTVVVISKAS